MWGMIVIGNILTCILTFLPNRCKAAVETGFCYIL